MTLRGNNKIYVELIQGTIIKPTPPDLGDKSPETLRELAEHNATAATLALGSNTPPTPISEALVRELVRKQKQENRELIKEYQVLVDKWDSINIYCYNQIFGTLEAIPASYQGNFKRFEILVNLQYKNNNPIEFVRKFKEALFEIQQRNSVVPPDMVLNFFVKAVQGNSRCHTFIQNLRPDLKDPNFIVEVYHDFTMTEGSNHITNSGSNSNSFNHSANTTSTKDSSASNSNSNASSNKKDKKKNDKSKSDDKDKQSSNKKDKKKQDHEKDAIWCKLHNALGNHYTRNCHLKAGGSANAVHQQPQQQPVQQQQFGFTSAYQHIQPPSTLYTAPVTKLASSLRRNTITVAISPSSTCRFCAVFYKPRFTSSGSSLAERGVLTDPKRLVN
ncbi:hypothetical protein E8E15_001386 [Penicillium rubens]|nr:hypothetical protein E8E15_001386 [Penicillium rubens]